MQWIKEHKKILIGGCIVVIVLLLAFFLGGPGKSEVSNSDNTETATETNSEETANGKNDLPEETIGKNTTTTEAGNPEKTTSETTEEHASPTTTEGTTEDEIVNRTEVATDKNVTTETTTEASVTVTEASTEPVTEAATFQCTVTISCSDILNNMDSLKPEKAGLVPESGIILSTTVTVTEGETAYEVLRRACTNAGIPLDASAGYVKGIQNLYEFDCGSNSGWKYTVNGMFPNYGSNAYVLKEGDSVLWNYSCN